MNLQTLEQLKSDGPRLFSTLGIDRPGNHCRCPFHGPDKKPSLSVWQGETGWVFRCHSAGCPAAKTGTIVDAVMMLEGLTAAKAIERLTGAHYTAPAARPKIVAKERPEPVPPVPDVAALARFMARARATLYESPELQGRWLQKRGLTLETVKRFGVGFMPFARFDGWQHSVKDAWALLITDAAGNPQAVKLHRENAKTGPKCLWAPFGTEPKERPRQGFPTLWPPPESDADFMERVSVFESEGGLDHAEAYRRAGMECGPLYLCPGELKALAIAGAGRAATSITGGENHRWTPGQVARLRGRRVVVVFDDDRAGIAFRDSTIQALRNFVGEIRAITFGRKEHAE